MRPSEITEIRTRMEMSGQAFSDLMGMSRSTLNKWENEHVQPTYFWSCILGALGYVVTNGTADQALELKARLLGGKADHSELGIYEHILMQFIFRAISEAGE